MEQLEKMNKAAKSNRKKLGRIRYKLLKIIGSRYYVKLPQLQTPVIMNKYYFDLLKSS